MSPEKQERIRRALKRQRRMLLLFFLTVVIPAGALGLIGLRALEADRIEMERVFRGEERSLNDKLQHSLEAELWEIHDQLEHLSETASYDGLAEVQKSYAGTLKNDSRYDGVILLGTRGDRFWVAENFLEVQHQETEEDPGWSRLEQLKVQEFGRRDLQAAADGYRQVAATSEGTLRLAALNDLGRTLVKKGDYLEAMEVYAQSLSDWPRILSSTDAPYLLIAGLRLYATAESLGRSGDALGQLIDVYEHMAEGRIRSLGILSFYSRQYEQLIDEACLENLEACREMTDLRERLRGTRSALELQDDVLTRVFNTVSSLQSFDDPRNMVLKIPKAPTLVVIGAPSRSPSEREPFFAVTLLDARLLLGRILDALDLDETSLGVEIVDARDGLLASYGGERPSEGVTSTPLSELIPSWTVSSFHPRESDLWAPHFAARNFYIALTVILVAILLFGGFLTFRTVAQEAALIRVKGQLVSIVSHEFKSPITSMRTLVERLQDGLVERPERKHQYLAIIGSELQRLTRLVNNLLDFSRIETGGKQYRMVATDVSELLENLLRIFEPRAYQMGFSLETKIPHGLPVVRVDPDSLAQAVLNLLDNAIKFSEEVKTIGVSVLDRGETLAISVEDRGPGIPVQESERIFEASYRSRESEERDIPGIGLGLSIVRHIAEAHGGRVEVEPRPGGGSRFSLVLPVGEEEVSAGTREFPKLVHEKQKTGTADQ